MSDKTKVAPPKSANRAYLYFCAFILLVVGVATSARGWAGSTAMLGWIAVCLAARAESGQ